MENGNRVEQIFWEQLKETKREIAETKEVILSVKDEVKADLNDLSLRHSVFEARIKAYMAIFGVVFTIFPHLVIWILNRIFH